MTGIEELCLERFFLGPGSEGPIGSVCVSDEDLVELFRKSDLEQAQAALVTSLPRRTLLRDYLSGELSPPTSSGKPDYLRILILVCWMQTSVKMRQRGERDFRLMLERHLNDRYQGAILRGLNPMWEHLAAYLLRDHGIELRLPEVKPHSQIGRTLRIAFPTWRDKAAMRKLRQVMDHEDLLNPLLVSNRIRTSRRIIADRSMQSFEYNFDLFDRARRFGGREYMETPFWNAWYGIVAEQAALEALEIAEGEFGEFEMFRVSPLGKKVRITGPDDAIKFVPGQIARSIKIGDVPLEPVGLSRFVSTDNDGSRIRLLHRSKLARAGNVTGSRSVDSDWVLARLEVSADGKDQAASGAKDFGWHGGIRIGGAYLGRPPLAPVFSSQGLLPPRIEINGREVATQSGPSGWSVLGGPFRGTAVAFAGKERRETLLVPTANEIDPRRRRAFDEALEISEDEYYHDTVPALGSDMEDWPGERHHACEDMITLGEALYARSVRGLSVGEAYDIASKALSAGLNDAPSGWDALRLFVDSGWFDSVLLRSFPARRLLQREITAERIGNRIIRIGGPTPIAVVERLEAVCARIGAELEVSHGPSRWSLPRYLIKTRDAAQQQIFLRRIELGNPSSAKLASIHPGDRSGVYGYDPIGRLDEAGGYFAFEFADKPSEGLYRLAKGDDHRNPYLYRSLVPGLAPTNYVSPALAIMAHFSRSKQSLFRIDGEVIVGTRNRIHLPASWARWLSDRTATNPGLELGIGSWRYIYPATAGTVSSLRRLVSIVDSEISATPWITRYLASPANRGRSVFDAKNRNVRTAGVVRGTR
ncbi:MULTISPECIES: hypothetical protein [unclassified Rhizobium]|uniref:hypothetical protein n=1 Tax=unclassified Rhizobium TaxID=2613769 RepID=UPI001ADB4894|nr:MULTISPECIES: hypothetical protein [unclassified Rhizobium]MBO9127951.1 hypothetical protein [Rhizobium sp. 16-488-2b]MBO9178528.1 hypothetical protein [Rhizobium sp. 16-488-2a]